LWDSFFFNPVKGCGIYLAKEMAAWLSARWNENRDFGQSHKRRIAGLTPHFTRYKAVPMPQIRPSGSPPTPETCPIQPRLVGYVRVSTCEQNTDLQYDALLRAGACVVYEDRVSGVSTQRNGLDAALADIGNGDKLMVWRLDRLGRSLSHIMGLLGELESKGASLVSLAENMDSGTESGELFATILAMIAHVERRMIVSRTRAGLQAAKDRGKILGRRPKMTAEQVAEAKTLMGSGLKAEAVAARYGVGRSTLFRQFGHMEA
jgi:DNA invertase Pin-like site-specific DNA recombinase